MTEDDVRAMRLKAGLLYGNDEAARIAHRRASLERRDRARAEAARRRQQHAEELAHSARAEAAREQRRARRRKRADMTDLFDERLARLLW